MLEILPLPPTASRLAVGRKRQRADAADRVPPLDRVPGVELGCLERGQRSAGIDIPDDDVADLVAGRQMAAVGRDGHGEEHRGEVGRRQLGMAAQLVDQPAARDIPEPADHVVGHAGDDASIGRGRDAADPFGMGEDISRTCERDSTFHQIKRPSYPPETSVVPARARPVT